MVSTRLNLLNATRSAPKLDRRRKLTSSETIIYFDRPFTVACPSRVLA
jgi:hypothetical protein